MQIRTARTATYVCVVAVLFFILQAHLTVHIAISIHQTKREEAEKR